MKKIDVLVVDDSAFIRKIVTDIIESDANMQVVAVARDGRDAVEKVKRYSPDVVTMDIEMPKLNGKEALKEIMNVSPTRVIMLSSLTTDGADATMECLSLGALDFVEKPSVKPHASLKEVRAELIHKIKSTIDVDIDSLIHKHKSSLEKREIESKTVFLHKDILSSDKLVLIASSTGGPRSLEKVIEPLPEKIGCPVIVVQHMPKGFTKSLADRLDKSSKIRVREARDGDELEKNTVYIAPGDYHLGLRRQGKKVRLFLDSTEKINNVRPAADFTFSLAADIYGRNIVSIVLTGMGKDATAGCEKIKKLGGLVIAESRDTCVVYGMPKSVVDKGITDYVLSNTEITEKLLSLI